MVLADGCVRAAADYFPSQQSGGVHQESRRDLKNGKSCTLRNVPKISSGTQ